MGKVLHYPFVAWTMKIWQEKALNFFIIKTLYCCKTQPQSLFYLGKERCFGFTHHFHLPFLRISPHIHRCLLPFSPRHLKSTGEYPFLVSHMKLFMATSPAVSWNLVVIHPLKFNQEYWKYIEVMVWSLLKTQSHWDSILFSHNDNGQPDSEG